jgi:hypothetical protein
MKFGDPRGSDGKSVAETVMQGYYIENSGE